MNDIDTINPCALDDNEIASVGVRTNKVFNVLGVMFFVTFLGYVALHCI